MSYHARSKEVPPPLEMIADLVYAPQSDIPFGKHVRIGLSEQTIYESAIEKGYQTGINAHLAFLQDLGSTEPIVLDDKQFTMVIKRLLPENLTPYEKGLWRSFFIVGWTCVYLGVETIDDDEEENEENENTQD